MKKLYFYLFALVVLVTACAKEDSLTPDPIKNWFAITEKDNMDVVDQKIYDIYQEYGIGIFYSDTLGYEDRGRRDSLGNVVYYYEVLDPTYDITESKVTTDITWSRVDVSTSEAKMKLLPLLEFMEENVLPFVKKANANIPVILITNELVKGRNSYPVYRGFNFLSVSLGLFDPESKDVLRTYKFEFIAQSCAKKIESQLENYYTITEIALSKFTSKPWGMAWCFQSTDPFYEYRWLDDIKEKLDAAGSIDELNKNVEKISKELANAKLMYQFMPSPELKAKIDTLTQQLEEANASIEEYQKYLEIYKRVSPEAYGMLGLLGEYTYTRTQDLQSFMATVFTMTEEEFIAKYEMWENVMLRYRLLLHTLKVNGFDPDEIRNSI